MDKIVMDTLEFASFHREVVYRLPFLKQFKGNKACFENANNYANQINLCDKARSIDMLSVVQDEIVSKFGRSLPGTSPTMYYSNIMWEYVYILLYYTHYADEIWQDTILPQMWKMQRNAVIRDEMRKGEEYINQYINTRKELKEKIHSNSTQKDSVPDIIQIMQDINKGNIRYTDVDWELQIKTILKLCNLMPTKFPNVIWLWGLLGEIDDITTRIDILHKMQEIATKCFEDLFLASEFIKDCDCIIYIYREALQYNLRNDIQIRHWWSGDQKCLNDLANILCKEMITPQFMVAIAEDMYQASQGDRKQAMLTLVLRANRNIGHISMDNIIDFAKNLYIAEGFRHLILSGEKDYRDIPALTDFEPKLLKACFEEYIRLRNAQIKEIIEQDLTHCGDAEELECLEYLLEEESQHVNRENMLEDFQGSAAYNAMWYPGRQKVLDMINVFVEYLNNKIKRIKKEEAKLGMRDNIQNFNVQGDYIAGDKHIGAHIDNVQPGGIGAQTTKE